jgi:hypothetical protein
MRISHLGGSDVTCWRCSDGCRSLSVGVVVNHVHIVVNHAHMFALLNVLLV